MTDERIELLQAPGTHRAMTDEELRAKLGPCYGHYRVHEHHYLDRPPSISTGTPATAHP